MNENGTNNYHKDLEFAENGKHDKLVEAIMRKAFPDVLHCIPNHKGRKSQRNGIDWTLLFDNEKHLAIDVKFRRKTWEDILLEFISCDTTNSPGWMEKDLHIDFILYIFLDSQIGIFLEWLLLQRTWRVCKEFWIQEYGTIPAKNYDNGIEYTTLSIPVPVEELLHKYSLATIIQLDKKKFKVNKIKKDDLISQLKLLLPDMRINL
jgi:hypothetical protein